MQIATLQAKEFYGNFVKSLRQQYSPQKVHDGRFGAMMDVSLVNDVCWSLSVPDAAVCTDLLILHLRYAGASDNYFRF